MKVLLVSDFYPPVIGGLERHVESLAHSLIKRGHEVRVVTIGDSTLPATRDGIEVKRCAPWGAHIPGVYADPGRSYHPPLPVRSMVKQIRAQLDSWRPDVLHSHGWSTYSAARALSQDRTPLVATIHDYGFICPRRTLFHRSGKACSTPSVGCMSCAKPVYGLKTPVVETARRRSLRLLGRVDEALAVSTAVEQFHRALFGERLRCVPNFLRESVVTQGSSHERADDPFVLFLGALTEEKGAQLIVDAWDETMSAQARLILVGRPHPSLQLRERPGVEIIPNAPYETVVAAMRNCALVVMPGLWPDPCPTVAFEAMAARKPIVASGSGGLIDIVEDGVTGVLVRVGDITRLRQAITGLLIDPKLRASMGELGSQRLKAHFTSSVVVPQILDGYERALSRRGVLKRS